jgi:rod shape determining protein RodA
MAISYGRRADFRGRFSGALERGGFIRQMDLVLVGAVLLLLIIGAFLVSAGTRNWYAAAGLDPNYYLKRHLINIFVGLVLGIATMLFDYRLLRAYTPILWVVAVLGLVAVLIPGIGSTINGAKAWITLPGGYSVEPGEFAKVAVIAGMAMLLAERREGEKDPKSRDVAQSLLIAGLPMLLIMLQPDLGTVMIISAAVVVVIAISGASWKWIAGLLLIACIGSVGAVKLHVLHDYQIKRLQSFVDPTADPQQSGYQLRQSRITIGSGGFLGKGLYKGPQTNGRFVPEQQTDFIFTVAGEELGFVGSAGIIGLFGIILWRAGRIARRSTDLFGRLVAGGVMAWFAFQIFENIGMAMGLMPMTGVPLPFLSYGGTSLFAVLIGVGLLENVHVLRS